MCRFCDDLEEWKEIEQSNKLIKYGIRLIMKHYKNNTKNYSEVSYGYYKIIFCPECGRKIKEA